jgi:hypothetical protein
MMNKLGILGIVIAIAFVAGIISVNPGAEGVSGWKAAVIELNEEITSLGEVFEEFLDQEEISELFEFDSVSVEDQDSSCADGQVVKFDSDPLSPTGWSCQDDDDTGDEGPFDSIQFNPLDKEPVTCSAETVGTMYYRDVSDPTIPDSLCVCTDLEGDGLFFDYWDLILGSNTCATP